MHSIIWFLTGQEPIELVSSSSSFGNFGQIIDNVTCLAKYDGDIDCSIWYSKTALGNRNALKVRVYGEQGSAEWLQENPENLHMTDRHGKKYILDRSSGEIEIANQDRYTRFKPGHPAGFIEALANYYCDIADSLICHVNNEDAIDNQLLTGIDETIGGLKMFEAIAESSTRRCWVKVK